MEDRAEAAAQKLLTRHKARASFLGWCEAVLEQRGQRLASHHRLIIDELQGVADGETGRLMIFAPPGSAKSTIVTKLFAPWILQRFPAAEVIGASHTATLAFRFSGEIQRIISDNALTLGYSLATENKEWWNTTRGGSYRAVGVGGSVPGTRADIVVVDDPIKSREAADSETERDNVWNWYNGDLDFRRKPGAPIVLMHTRWSPDDLAGRLLQSEQDGWRILTLRAQAEDDDPLGRKPGDWLWDDDPQYAYGKWLREQKSTCEARGATREWASQFQQRPRPAEGILFKVGMIDILDAAPMGRDGALCRGWDFAATKQIGSRDPDWSRGVLLKRLPNKTYVVMDVVGCQGTPDEVLSLVKHTARMDREKYGPVTISIPQDPGQAGKMQVEYYTKELAGYIVKSSPESGDKQERAKPIASQVNVRNVAVVQGPWTAAFLDELGSFPAGAHDDQVDGLSRAFGEVGLGPVEFNPDPSIIAKAKAGQLMRSNGRRSLLA